MPRVNGVMQPIPGAYGVPNTPIESSKYNGQLDDLIADANNARPVTAGGIGASTSVGGADNLSTTGTDIASSATTNLAAATGVNITITGTTTITGFGTAPAGAKRWITFAGVLTLTYNATKLILPGAANITTAAGDTCVALSLGSGNWRVISFTPASGKAVINPSAADLLEAIKTVDGPDSGLDADLLDGQHGSFYTDAANLTGTYGAIQIGANGPVSGAKLSVVTGGNEIEFGHSNAAGFRSTVGAEATSGKSFLAFNAEAGITANTYRTRGNKGAVIRGDLAGGITFGTLANANADNQAVTGLGSLTADGTFAAANLKADGSVYAGSAYMGSDGQINGTQWGGNLSTYLSTTFAALAGATFTGNIQAPRFQVDAGFFMAKTGIGSADRIISYYAGGGGTFSYVSATDGSFSHYAAGVATFTTSQAGMTVVGIGPLKAYIDAAGSFGRLQSNLTLMTANSIGAMVWAKVSGVATVAYGSNVVGSILTPSNSAATTASGAPTLPGSWRCFSEITANGQAGLFMRYA